jgi:hemolysin-activating ACP:hemolysin acyltransferase
MSDLDKALKDHELNETASNAETQKPEPTAGDPAKKIDPALAKKLTESRQRLHVTMAQVVLAMVSASRYKHCTIAELQHLVIEPLLRDRVAIATAAPKDAAAPSLSDGQVVGVAIWAKVSAEVDAKIREQIKAGVFPIRLKPEDWASGDLVWLLDVIAPTKKQATAVLSNFHQIVKDGNLLVHPIVRRLVDQELLKGATSATAKRPVDAEISTTH